jgi:hypothetical protein
VLSLKDFRSKSPILEGFLYAGDKMKGIMNYSTEFTRLCEFVREIQNYYMLNKHKQALAGDLVVSKAMVSFALYDLSEKDLNTFIETLQQEGFILSSSNDQLIFPATFPNAVC